MLAVLVNGALASSAAAEGGPAAGSPVHSVTKAHSADRATARLPLAVKLAELTSDLTRMWHALAMLSEETGSLTDLILEAQFAGVDLSGSWQLTLPAGFDYPAKIAPVPGSETHLRLDVRAILRGVYRRDSRYLRVTQPTDRWLREFVWELVSPDHLVLIESPPVAKTGADYRGATLRRLGR